MGGILSSSVKVQCVRGSEGPAGLLPEGCGLLYCSPWQPVCVLGPLTVMSFWYA